MMIWIRDPDIEVPATPGASPHTSGDQPVSHLPFRIDGYKRERLAVNLPGR